MRSALTSNSLVGVWHLCGGVGWVVRERKKSPTRKPALSAIEPGITAEMTK